MADYSSAPTKQGSGELIPHGTLAKGWFVVEPFNVQNGHIETPPKAGGKAKNSYLKAKVAITEGEHERRVVFHNLMRGPEEKARNMGNAQLRAILEFGNGFPNNPRWAFIDDDYGQLWDDSRGGGMPCAIKIGIEKGKDGYQDKNVIMAFLSPNPESDTYKDFQRLIRGDTAPSAPAKPGATPAANSWTPAAPATAPQPSTGTPPATGGWGADRGVTGQTPQPQAAAQAPAQPAFAPPKKPAFLSQ